jgi:hypothetical protein
MNNAVAGARSYDMRVARWMRPLLAAAGMGRRRTRVVVDDGQLHVVAGFWFRAHIDLDALKRVRRARDMWWAIGVHTDFRGGWLVNGSPRGIVMIDVAPPAPARFVGIRVKVRRLGISLEEPDVFVRERAPA